MATAPTINRMVRRAIGVGLGIMVLLVAAIGSILVFGGRFDLAALAGGRLTARLDRTVSIGSLHMTPGRWVHVELRDLQLANLPGGSQAIMISVPSASAEIQAISLLHGPVVLRELTVDGLRVLLEHVPDGSRNWEFGNVGASTSPKPFERSRFPTLLNARVTGDVVFRTRDGHPLGIHMDHLRLSTEAADKPVRLAASGLYNGTDLALEGELASLDVLRDPRIPYPARLTVSSGGATLHFRGTMTDPLNVDGADGVLDLVAPTMTAILKIAGVPGDFGVSLRLGGTFLHDGPLWHLSQASGALNQDTITGADLKLLEGAHGAPDDVTAELAFDHLVMNRLLAAKTQGSAANADMPLTVDRAPDTLIAAKVTARELTYAGLRASDLTFGGSLKPGRITVDVLSLDYLGAPFRASGQIEAVPGLSDTQDGRVTANIDMSHMDVQVLRKLLSAGELPLFGGIDGRILVEATGATLNQAARASRLSAIFAMDRGSIARRIIELASTDARTIFRKASGMSAVTCLVGVVDIRGGLGTISPLRIRTANGTITGRGTFDIFRHQIDITVASEASTTSAFALDVPVRVSGAFASPTIRPASLSAAGRAQLSAGDNVRRLLPSLRPFARRVPCLSARAG